MHTRANGLMNELVKQDLSIKKCIDILIDKSHSKCLPLDVVESFSISFVHVSVGASIGVFSADRAEKGRLLKKPLFIF